MANAEANVAESVARERSASLDDLVNVSLVRLWLYWGMFWLMFAPTVGVLISTYFNYPGYLGDALEVQFGRLRPVHVNGVIFGAFSTLFLGLCYYLVPRLCGIRLVGERWGYHMAWLWNLGLAAGFASLVLGYNQGWRPANSRSSSTW